jgi:hypothetical protein
MRLLHGCALQRLGHRYRALGAKEMISHMTSLFKQVFGWVGDMEVPSCGISFFVALR